MGAGCETELCCTSSHSQSRHAELTLKSYTSVNCFCLHGICCSVTLLQSSVYIAKARYAVHVQIRKLAPKHLAPEERSSAHMAHVTCANFSRQGEIVATYNDEVSIYSLTSDCSCDSTADQMATICLFLSFLLVSEIDEVSPTACCTSL